MTDIKSKVQGLDPNIRARDVKSLGKATGNIYETLNIIAKRANPSRRYQAGIEQKTRRVCYFFRHDRRDQ